MRQSYVQHPVTLELIPRDQYVPPKEHRTMIMPDIKPYKSVIDGSEITSRSKHRAHLRQHGCIEVGNEKQKPKQLGEVPGRKEAIMKAMYQHGLLR